MSAFFNDESLDECRLADLIYIAKWCYQNQSTPSNIYDLAARALDVGSLAHGFAPEVKELPDSVGHWAKIENGNISYLDVVDGSPSTSKYSHHEFGFVGAKGIVPFEDYQKGRYIKVDDLVRQAQNDSKAGE